MAARLGVLVVDDDRDLRILIGAVLEDSGYEVRTAADGGAALELLRGWRPDLILLDVMMPGVDGRAFRRAQLEQEALASIPVVVMSAGCSAHREAAKLATAAALEKPFDLGELLEIVAALTRRVAAAESEFADSSA